MNHNLINLYLKRILMIWAVLTLLFIFAGLLVFSYNINAKAFITLANIVNSFLLLSFYLLRKRIEKIITNYMNKSKGLSFSKNCKYEKEIGYIMISLLIPICSVIIYLALFDIYSYRTLIQEDGIVEYGSAILWFFSAIFVCFQTITLARRETDRHKLIFNIMLIAFFIVCCGEEISWGQRIFGIETPELMRSVNVQNEITLHNIISISVFSNVFFLITIVFFLFVPFLINKNTTIKNVLYFIHFPIPNRFAIYVYVGTLLVWIFIGVRFGTLGFHRFSFYPEQYYVQMDDEIFELLAAYSFLCFSIHYSATQLTIIKNYQAKA